MDGLRFFVVGWERFREPLEKPHMTKVSLKKPSLFGKAARFVTKPTIVSLLGLSLLTGCVVPGPVVQGQVGYDAHAAYNASNRVTVYDLYAPPAYAPPLWWQWNHQMRGFYLQWREDHRRRYPKYDWRRGHPDRWEDDFYHFRRRHDRHGPPPPPPYRHPHDGRDRNRDGIPDRYQR